MVFEDALRCKLNQAGGQGAPIKCQGLVTLTIGVTAEGKEKESLQPSAFSLQPSAFSLQPVKLGGSTFIK